MTRDQWTGLPLAHPRCRLRRRGVLLAGVLPPPPGGVETITKLIWDSPLRERYHVSLFITRKSRGKEYSGRFDARNTLDAGRQALQCLWMLVRMRPRVFHTPLSGRWSGFLRDITLIWLARLCGCYVVAHCQSGGASGMYAQAMSWQKRLIRLLLRGADHFLVQSSYWERHFSRLAPRTPRTILPNAVRPLFLVGGERSSSGRPADFTMLFVGAIGRQKGVFDLLDAAAAVRPRIPEMALRLVGVAGEPAALADVAGSLERLGIADCVTVVGPRYEDDLLHEYLDVDVYVLPTYVEGQPVALIEAMATGACVISTTIPAVESVVTDGTDGLLVPPGDSVALARAIERVFGDPDLRATLGENAQRTVRERFTPEQFLRDLDAFYQHILQAE